MVYTLESASPELIFTPERRRLEYKLVVLAQKAIKESKKIPEKEKPLAIKSWWKYLFEYERLYNLILEQKFFQEIQENLKQTDLLKKDYEADKSWKKYCIKRDSKNLN